MTEELVVIKQTGESVVEFSWLNSLCRVSSNTVEEKHPDGKWSPLNPTTLASHTLRADRICRGEEPPADGFELKQEQGKVLSIARPNGFELWLSSNGTTWIHTGCTPDEIIAIADILKGERDG